MLAEVWLILTSTTLLKKYLWRILSGFLDLLRLSASPMSSPSSSFLLIKFYFYLYKPGCNSGEQHCRDQKVPHHPSLCPSISSPNSNIIYFTYLIFCNRFFCRSHTWRFPNRHHCVVRPLSNVKKSLQEENISIFYAHLNSVGYWIVVILYFIYIYGDSKGVAYIFLFDHSIFFQLFVVLLMK